MSVLYCLEATNLKIVYLRVHRKKRITTMNNVVSLFQVHINLMILEARNQAELLYALREIMRYMT